MDQPGGIEFRPVSVAVGRPGGLSGRRARLVVAGWALGLASVAALGLSGHEPAPEAASISVAGTPFPPPTPAPAATNRAAATQRLARPLVTPHRALGDDGLVGGIVFGDNVRRPDGPT